MSDDIDFDEIKNNGTFCIYPFVHQIITSAGTLMPCCPSMDDDYGAAKDLLNEWNGEYMRELRRALVEGEKHGNCAKCWKREAVGDESFRERYNKIYLHRKKDVADSHAELVKNTIRNGMRVDTTQSSIEFRFGNLCNLQCKMCHPNSSSQIVKDLDRLKVIDPEGFDHIGAPHLQGNPSDYLWYENPQIWETIDQIIPNLDRVHITGGEPTLSIETIRFMERCIELGYADKIFISFCINATNLPDRFMNAIKQFKCVNISLSIDGIGPSFEYIRYPGNWEKVKTNILRIFTELNDPKKHFIGYNVAVQIYNIVNLGEIINELLAIPKSVGYQGDVRFDNMYVIDHPTMISINGGLTPAVRREALQRMLEWYHTDKEKITYPLPEKSLDWILTILITQETGPHRAKQILRYSQFYDHNKKLSLEKALPELYDLLKQDANG